MERVVQVIHEGRVYTFRVDSRPPLAFWRVEVAGREPDPLPVRVTGGEEPEFFRSLARMLAETH